MNAYAARTRPAARFVDIGVALREWFRMLTPVH
jgi:hypothetical protein